MVNDSAHNLHSEFYPLAESSWSPNGEGPIIDINFCSYLLTSSTAFHNVDVTPLTV